MNDIETGPIPQTRATRARPHDDFLQPLLKSSSSGVCSLDRDGYITACNDTFLTMLGLAGPEQAVGRKLHDVTRLRRSDGSFLRESECPIYRCAATGQPAHAEGELFSRADGTPFAIEYWALPILRDGAASGAMATFIDITERRRAQEALKEARGRLDAALTAGEIGTYVWEVVADRLYGDRNFDKLFGIPMDADGAAPLSRFVEVIHPDDRARTLAEVQKTLDTGCDYQAEYRIITGGRERWVIARGKVERDESGRIVRFPGVLLDITDRKRAEQLKEEVSARLERQTRLFEGIASTTPDFIYVLDLNGRFLYANRSLLKIWGLCAEEAVGKNFYELGYQPWHAAMHMRELAQVIRTRQPVSGEVPFTGASGISGIYEYIFTPVLGPDGAVEVIAGTTRDVTQRKHTEQALHQGKELLTIALAASETGTFRYDLGRREFVDFDENLRRLFGLPLERPVRLAEEFLRQVHPDDLPAVSAAVERTLTQAVDFEMEFRVLHEDGSVHWLFDRAKVMRDKDGTPSYLVGACTDVTRARASEAAARSAAERFRFLAETMPQKIFTATATGEVDYFNQQWLDYAGLAREELLSWGWAKLLHPEDLEKNLQAWKQAVASGDAFQYEHRFRRSDGVYRWHLSRARAMRDADGRLLMWVGSNTDIDDVKRSQQALQESAERLRAALDAANTGTFRWDLRSNAVNWDENLDRMFRVPLGQAVRTLDDFLERVHPEDRPAVVERCRRVASEGLDFDMEFRTIDAAGNVRWIDSKGKVSCDESGAPRHLTGACLDISARKAAEQERVALLDAERRARSDAEAANRLKDEFLATLSHELRTPLSSILGWAQILRRHHAEGTEVGDGLAVIERNARVQVKLIEELLDMSRIMSGKLRMDVHRVELGSVIETAVASILPAAEAKGIRIDTVLAADAGVVRGDAARLQQVFWNLLSNAIKFTPAGGQVQVTLKRSATHVEISVADTGSGIAPEFLPHMFQRFRQADGAINRRHGGLGLGLAIVKSLVEMHGGSVRVASAGLGRGTTFTVELPLGLASHDGAADARQQLQIAGASAGPVDDSVLDNVAVLVVDDEPDARDLIRRLLQESRARVTVAADVAEAVTLLREHRFDVILSDIGMPGEDGYSLIRRLRQLPAQEGGATAAVALTAFAHSEDRLRALRAGFHAHLVKPVDPGELVAMVASLANKSPAVRH